MLERRHRLTEGPMSKIEYRDTPVCSINVSDLEAG
jgi:hypothetical protein